MGIRFRMYLAGQELEHEANARISLMSQSLAVRFLYS